MIVKLSRPMITYQSGLLASLTTKTGDFSVDVPYDEIKHLFSSGELEIYCEATIDEEVLNLDREQRYASITVTGQLTIHERIEGETW